MIITNLTEQMMYNILMETIKENFDKEQEFRETSMDYYEGINLQQDLKKYFDSDSLSQIPPAYLNLTKNIIDRRCLVYQEQPMRHTDEKYLDHIGDFDSSMKEFEKLVYLLGTEALYTYWSEDKQKLMYRPIHFFTPFFRPNEDDPFMVMWQVESQLQARSDDAQFMVWSRSTEDMPGKHFMISSKGKITSVVEGDLNPFGDVIPINFGHRSFMTRDFMRAGAEDIIDANRSINIMLTEMALSSRFQLGQPTISGIDTEARIQFGQDKALILPEGASFNYVTPNANIGAMKESIKFLIDSVSQANNVKMNWTSGQAESGLSKKMSQLDLMDSLRSDVEQIYRPFEREQFKIAQRVLEVSGGINISDEFSVDFQERSAPMSQDEELKYYEWAFQNNLESRQSYLRKKNPDLKEEEILDIVQQIDEEAPQEVKPTGSILDQLGR